MLTNNYWPFFSISLKFKLKKWRYRLKNAKNAKNAIVRSRSSIKISRKSYFNKNNIRHYLIACREKCFRVTFRFSKHFWNICFNIYNLLENAKNSKIKKLSIHLEKNIFQLHFSQMNLHCYVWPENEYTTSDNHEGYF